MPIDHKFELGRLQDRKVRGLGTLENAAGIHADLTNRIDNVGPVTHQQSGFDQHARRKARGYTLAHCQRGKLHAAAGEEAVARDEKGIGTFTRKGGKGGVDLIRGGGIEENDVQPKRTSGLKPRRVIAKVEWHPGELYPRVGFIVTNMTRPAERVVAFYNKRGTCEQWIKEGKGAIKWTRLSCRTFAANAVRLQLHALAYNLGNFLRTLATPEPIKDWSLTSLKEKLIKIGAKVVSHGRYVVFQMAEVAIPRQMFQEILRLIAELRPQPPPAPA